MILPLLLWSFQAMAQQTIKGKVVDSQSQKAIPGVNVLVLGSSNGAATDANGMYQLRVNSLQDTLRFSYIGYNTKVVPINGRTTINVNLQSKTISGQEVVVVGYGTQKAENVTSAISSVSSDDFTQSSPTDAASLIKGKIAGLSVTNPSGDPTAGSQIRLRGTTTLQGPTNPLVLVDGIPGDLSTVAPQNIKSVDVLKGGSAAAIYGSRGSNGVILITTKEHGAESNTTIQYNGYVNVQTIKKRPNMLDAAGVRKWQSQYPNLKDYGYSTDWINVITRTPVGQSHNLSFSGGSGQTNYTASINYKNQQGLFLHTDNEEVVGRVNINHSMFDNKLQANLRIVTHSHDYWTGGDGSSWNGFVYRNALTRNPTDRAKDAQGNYIYRSGFEYENPLVLLNEAGGKNKNRELRMNGKLTFHPIPTLSFKLTGSSSQWTQLRGYAETLKHVSAVEGGTPGYASRGTGGRKDNLLEFTGTYSNDFGPHSVTLLGGYSYQQHVQEDYFMQNYGFPTDAYGYNRMQSGNALTEGKATMNSYKQSHKLIGFFSRLNYNYDNRYLLMASVRYEGNSKFGSNNKWGWFPAVSAGWRISNENFMSNVDFVNNLKLRAGYGVTGIAPENPYQSLASLNYGAKIYNNGQWVQGLAPSRNPNPNLRWERKEELDVGLDFSMFNDRLSGTLDIYRRNTKDMLWNYDVPVPPNVYSSILANVGQMRNEGIEASLDFDVFHTKNLYWKTSVTFSTNRNKLVTLSNDLYQTTNDFFYTGYTGAPIQLPTHKVTIGGPIGNFYGYKSVDIDQNGQWIVLDKNGNRISLDNASLDDRHILGNGIPDYHLGWNNTFRYKNFDLNINMRGAFAFQILNFQRMFYENPTLTPENMLKSAFDKVYGKRRLNTTLAYVSYYVENGDYWKLDNATLGYTFDVSNKLGGAVQHARIYVSGSNLFTITGYKGMDPEVDSSGLTPGNDPRDKFPTTRTFTLGLNLTF